MKAVIATLFAGAIFLSGCEMMQPQPDPTLNRLADIERRLAAIMPAADGPASWRS